MKNPRRFKFFGVILILTLFFSIFLLDLSRRKFAGEFETGDVELTMLYSSEKATWLETVAPLFEEEWAKNYTKGLKLVLTPIGTRKGSLEISRGIEQPVIWSPASSFWIPIMNKIWTETHDTILADPASLPLVKSPLVIAVWQSYAQKNNITSLESLHELALKDPSFTFAHTDPQSSNSGYGAVIMEAAVAAKKDPVNLTLQDLASESVQSWMKTLEAKAIQYGESTGFLAKLMQSRGPSVLKVAIIYENLVIEKNKGIESLWPGEHILAVYPSEGTVMNDHPFILLNAPWVTSEQREAARIFLNFLRRPDIQRKAIETGFRPGITLPKDDLKNVFDPTLGVKTSLDNVKIFDLTKMDADVLSRIPDLWLATRSFGSNNEGANTEQLINIAFFGGIILSIAILVIVNYVSKKKHYEDYYATT